MTGTPVIPARLPWLAAAVPLFLTFGAGALLAWQSHVNAGLADGSHSWLLAALVSFTVGTLALSVVSFGRAAGRTAMARVLHALRGRTLSWWVLMAGLLSSAYVVLQSGTVTTLGVALFSLAVTSGMNVGSLVVDRVEARWGIGLPITGRRLLAVAVSLLAALLAILPQLGQQSPPLLYVALVFAAGVAAAIQFAMTARVSAAGADSAVAAWFLFAVAALLLALLSLLRGEFGAASVEQLRSTIVASPGLLVGGLLGAAVVVTNAYVVPRTGVLVFSLSLIAGQLLAALLIDLWQGALEGGWFVTAACALMMLATAISAGAASPFRRRHR
ncbi:MAG: DMT family transporter [Actinomycetes bacterium]